MRALGAAPDVAVARTIAFGSGIPAASASANHE
ncbi:unannotated protein [freshwater metagenome]|uniref:Unannotated protein n=1 Tax=freshwater metagenome TaxID=449393 RepID=A0A6J7KMK5_9ZZZZ